MILMAMKTTINIGKNTRISIEKNLFKILLKIIKYALL